MCAWCGLLLVVVLVEYEQMISWMAGSACEQRRCAVRVDVVKIMATWLVSNAAWTWFRSCFPSLEWDELKTWTQVSGADGWDDFDVGGGSQAPGWHIIRKMFVTFEGKIKIIQTNIYIHLIANLEWAIVSQKKRKWQFYIAERQIQRAKISLWFYKSHSNMGNPFYLPECLPCLPRRFPGKRNWNSWQKQMNHHEVPTIYIIYMHLVTNHCLCTAFCTGRVHEGSPAGPAAVPVALASTCGIMWLWIPQLHDTVLVASCSNPLISYDFHAFITMARNAAGQCWVMWDDVGGYWSGILKELFTLDEAADASVAANGGGL